MQAVNLEGPRWWGGSRNAGGESRGSSLDGRDPATQAVNLEGPRWWGGSRNAGGESRGSSLVGRIPQRRR